MIISKRLSNKIKIISFLSIVSVVWMHAYYIESENCVSIHFIQRYVSLFADFAVPMFYVISGFLFFANIDKQNIKQFFANKIKKRLHTLLVPYFIWSTIFIIIVYVVRCFYNLNTDYFNYCERGEWVKFFLYVYWSPAAFHLWFIRDLFIVVLCTPLIYLFLKYVPLLVQLILLLTLATFQFIPIISWALFWFTLGAMFAFNDHEPFDVIRSKKTSCAFVILYMIAIAIFTAFDVSLASNKPYTFIVLLLGVIGIWHTLDYFCSYTIVKPIINYTFFIYCSHIPLLNIIKTLIYPHLINSNIGILLGYIFSPIITIAICSVLGKLIKSRINTMYKILTGGR